MNVHNVISYVHNFDLSDKFQVVFETHGSSFIFVLYYIISDFYCLFCNIQIEEKKCDDNDGPVVKKLLKLIVNKTNRHFKGLCECLIETEQEYIVKHCLSQEGKYIIKLILFINSEVLMLIFSN